jgi:hypothetical protein
MPLTSYPDWMDRTGIGVIGKATLADGEQLTVEIVSCNDELTDLILNIISADRPDIRVGQTNYAIPIDDIVSFEPQPRETQSWPHSDPCRQLSKSLSRSLLMSTLFLSASFGSIALFLLIPGPYSIQEASVITYTLAVTFGTFAATGKAQKYLFTCPAVRPELPKLLLRHLAFLVLLVIFLSAALASGPALPAFWNTPDRKGATVFQLTVGLLCYALGVYEIWSNRSILAQSHKASA